MTRKACLVLAVLVLGLLTPSAVAADGEIEVLVSEVELSFPDELVFFVVAESESDIVRARLRYQVDRLSHATVVSEGWADFVPGKRIEGSWTWDMRKSSLPPGAALQYWWVLEDAAGRRFESEPERLLFEDDRYEWRTLGDGDLTLSWYEGSDSFGEELLEASEAAVTRLQSMGAGDLGWSGAKLRPMKVYVYASSQDLQGSMIFPQEWTGGVAFTEFGIIGIGISPLSLDWGKRALTHELTHLVVHQLTYGPYSRLPTWLDEGLAMYNEGELEAYLLPYLEEAILGDELISVRSLCSPFSADPGKAYLSYAQSYSLVDYLLGAYGDAQMFELLNVIAEGNTYDDALTMVYGFDIDGLDRRWRAWVRTPASYASSLERLEAVFVSVSALPAHPLQAYAGVV